MSDSIEGIFANGSVKGKFTSNEETTLLASLDTLLEEIKACNDMHSAGPYLDDLSFLQEELARACFKWHITLPSKLRQLVSEFDHTDDPELRASVFNKIKNGNFLSSRLA